MDAYLRPLEGTDPENDYDRRTSDLQESMSLLKKNSAKIYSEDDQGKLLYAWGKEYKSRSVEKVMVFYSATFTDADGSTSTVLVLGTTGTGKPGAVEISKSELVIGGKTMMWREKRNLLVR